MSTRASPDDPPALFSRAARAADGVRTAGSPTAMLGHRIGESDGIYAGWIRDSARLRVETDRCGAAVALLVARRRHLNDAVLLSRLGIGLLVPDRIRWMAPWLSCLGQLEALNRKENAIESTLSA